MSLLKNYSYQTIFLFTSTIDLGFILFYRFIFFCYNTLFENNPEDNKNYQLFADAYQHR